MTVVGFTGTRHGVTHAQRQALACVLETFPFAEALADAARAWADHLCGRPVPGKEGAA